MPSARSFVRSLVALGLFAASGSSASCDVRGPAGGAVASSDPYLSYPRPTADTYVDATAPTTNFGLAHTMRIRADRYMSLVRFDADQIAIDLQFATVLSAQLTVWVQAPITDMSCEFFYEIHPMRRRWTQFGANSQSGATFQCANAFSGSCAPQDVWDFSTGAAVHPYHSVATDRAGCNPGRDPDGTARLVFDVTPDLSAATNDGVEFGWTILGSEFSTGTHLATLETLSSEGGRPAELELVLGPNSFVPREPLAAPPLDRSRPTSVFDATRFIYDSAFQASPDDIVQWGMAAALIEPDRAAHVHGRVLDINGQPRPGVDVRFYGHPEYGQTRSRASGEFDLVVNGGGTLVLEYSRPEFVTAQRVVAVAWGDTVRAPDVTLLATPTACTPQIGAADSGFYFNPGWTIADRRGTRRMALFVPAGTSVVGSAATSFQICLDESTRAPSGPPCSGVTDCPGRLCIDGECVAEPSSTMPADVAQGTSYTFAMEGCVHEPGATGPAACHDAAFPSDVYLYLRTFGAGEEFPVGDLAAGQAVPNGSYDRLHSVWGAEANGLTIEVTRSGTTCTVDRGTQLPLGTADLTPAELAAICGDHTGFFPDGLSRFWRVPRRHFSPGDLNWVQRMGAFLQEGTAESGTADINDDCQNRSILFCESRSLGERVPLVGTPFQLAYSSSHQVGRGVDNSILVRPIPLGTINTATLGSAIEEVFVRVEVAGRELEPFVFQNRDVFAPDESCLIPRAPCPTHRFYWNGLDGWDRPTLGPQTAQVLMTYHVVGRYIAPPAGVAMFGGTVVAGGGGGGGGTAVGRPPGRTDQFDITFTITRSVTVGTVDDAQQGLGGWNLDVHHTFSPASHSLYMGTGERRGAFGNGTALSFLPLAFEPCAGGATAQRCGGDCPAAAQVPVTGVASATDGTTYMAGGVAGQARRLWRLRADATFADPSGRHEISGIAIPPGPRIATGRDPAELFVTGEPHGCVQRARIDGDAGSVIASLGACGGSCPAGSPILAPGTPLDSTQSSCAVFHASDIDVGPDDSLYIADADRDADRSRILRWRPDGSVEVVAVVPHGLVATQVEAAVNGNVFVTIENSGYEDRIYRFTLDGRLPDQPCGLAGSIDCLMTRVVGAQTYGSSSAFMNDGTLGTSFWLSQTGAGLPGRGDLASDSRGRLYLTQMEAGRLGSWSGLRVWRLEDDATMSIVAGSRPIDSLGSEMREPDSLPGVIPPTASHCDIGSPATITSLNSSDSGSIDVAADGRVLITQGGLGVLQVAPVMQGGLVDDHVVASSDGGALYHFDARGRHLRTVDFVTGRTLVSFLYDGAGRLSQITDAEGVDTLVTYSPNEIRLETGGSGGLITRLGLSGGYATTIVDPAGHTTTFNYDPPAALPAQLGLMRTLTEPGMSASHAFTYDELGRITSDATVPDVGTSSRPTIVIDDAPGVPRARGTRVSRTTSPEGRVRIYQSWESGYTHRRTLTSPTGYVDRLAAPSDGRQMLHSVSVGAGAGSCHVQVAMDNSISLVGCGVGEICNIETTVPGATGACVPYRETVTMVADPNRDLGDDARYARSTVIERARTTDFATGAREILTTSFAHQRFARGVGDGTPCTDSAAGIVDCFNYPLPGSAAGVASVTTRLDAPFTTTVRAATVNTPVTTITRDDRGRVTCIESTGSFPTSITYAGASRRPSLVRQAAFAAGCSGAPSCSGGSCGTREASFAYTTDHTRWLQAISTGTGSTAMITTLVPEHATGWVDRVFLPGHTQTIDITYDERGNIRTFTPPSRPAHQFTVTQRDFSDSYTPPMTSTSTGAEVVHTEYTDDGQLHVVHFNDGATIELDYDATRGTVTDLRGGDTAFPMHYAITSDTFGQPLHIGDASASLDYDYDVTMPARETSAGPAGRQGVVRWNVGSALMLESEQVTLGVGTTSTTATLAYDYDADAVLRTVHLSTAATSTTTSVEYRRTAPPTPPAIWTPISVVTAGPTGESTTTTISVTPFGELSQLSTSPSSGSGPWYETEICARDSQGRITDRRELLPATPTGHGHATLPRFVFHHFEYDAAGRLHRDRGYSRTATETCASWLASFASNPLARADLSDQTMAYTENGGLTSGSQTSCSTFDAADRPICHPSRTYNARGQLTSPGHGDELAYDVLGRIRSFRHGGTRITYDWDPASRLVHIGGSGTGEEHFVYDGARAVAWRRGNDTSFFVYGSMGHVPDLMYRDLGSNGSIDETYRLVTDERGSVRLVVRIDGPTAGIVAQRIDYDAWGFPSFVSGDARMQPFGFAGGLWLSDAGLWRFGARDYDPGIGSWTAGDPIGFAGGENVYRYCGADPINCIDPSGLQGWEEAAALIFVVSFATGAPSDTADHPADIGALILATLFMGLPAGSPTVVPPIPASLAGGRSTFVYFGMRGSSRVYAGITVNLTRRAAEHALRRGVDPILSMA